MKKQILLLTFFVLAIFAGMPQIKAQQLPASEATLTPLTCVTEASPLHPVAGIPFTYEMNGTGENAADTWTWFATKDSSFIDGGVLDLANMLTTAGANPDLLDVSGNYGTSGDADTVSITWSSEILANTEYEGVASKTVFPSPTFVVGYATGALCATDNIEVYEINPTRAFYIDIANIDQNGDPMAWDVDTSQCVSPVVSAIYDSPGDSLMMDYGADTLYFEIAAAGFVTNWTPTFRVTGGISNSQTATIGLATSLGNAQSGTFIESTTNTWTSGDVGATGDWTWPGTAFTAVNDADISSGVSVWARVIIDNNTYESLASQAFSLAVDAQDGTGLWDMEDDDCTTLVDANDQVDEATHIILPRPTINHATADPNTAEPNDIIDKQRQ